MISRRFGTEALGYNRQDVDNYIDNLESEIRMLKSKQDIHKTDNKSARDYLSIEVTENSEKMKVQNNETAANEIDKTKMVYEKFKEETDTKFYLNKVRENLSKIRR